MNVVSFLHGGPEGKEEGFSILEVLISLTILLTVLVSVSSLMVTSFKVGANSRFRQVATEIATSTLDAQVQTGATTLLGEVGDKGLPTVTSAGQNYLEELEVTPYQPGSAGCQSPQGNGEAMLKVTVWVTWADELSGSTWWIAGSSSTTGLVVEETTLLAVPSTDLNPSAGTLLVTVDNATGDGVQGVSITATNGSATLTATTTTSGCALFTNIAPGDNWTVTGSESGYIDNYDHWSTATNSAATLTSGTTPVDVLAATTTTEAWNYDQSTVTPAYSVTLAGQSPWLPTNLNSLPLTFYSSYFPSGVTSYEAVSPALAYPYYSTTNPSYYVVAGTCGIESAPDGANLSGATTDGQPVTLTSGGRASPVFPLTPLDLVITDGGNAVSNASATASVSSTDANCGTGTLAMPTLGLGTSCVPNEGCIQGAAHRTGHGKYHDALLVSSCSFFCSTNTTLSSGSNPSVYGAQVTFTATVTCQSTCSSMPTGTVTFKNGSTTLGTGNLNGANPDQASYTTTASQLALNSNSITASYGGSGWTWSGSTSGAFTQTVNAVGTTTVLVSNPDPNAYGTSAILTATVSSNSPSTLTPTGKINFTSGGATIAGCGSVTLSSGSATCTWTALSGFNGGTTYSAAATYTPTGSSGFNASTSPTITQSVTAASTTTTLSSSSPSGASTGTPVTFTAAVSAASGGPATGTITFSDNGSAIAACSTPVTLVSQSATCTTSALTAGNHTITAVFNPTNSNNLATSTTTLSQFLVSPSGTPSIMSGLPYGVWILTVTYGTHTNSVTVTVTPGYIQVGSGTKQAAGSLIVVAD